MKYVGAVLAACCVLLAACTSVVPASPPADLDLAGTSWVTSRIGEEDLSVEPFPTLVFDAAGAASVSGNSGCNQFFGSYTLKSTQLSFGELGSTLMACVDDTANAREAAFTQALKSTASASIDDHGLRLFDSAGTQLLLLTPDTTDSGGTSPSLWDTTWLLTDITTSEATSSAVDGSEVTITLTETELSGKACNTFGAAITLEGEAIEVGPIRSTKMACPSEDLSAQETAVLLLLEQATGFTLDGDQLVISGPGGSLSFQARG